MSRSAHGILKAAMMNTIYVYILNIARFCNDCIIVNDVNCHCVSKCARNFEGFDDEYNLCLYIERREAL